MNEVSRRVCMYVCVGVCVRVSAASPAVASDVTPSHYLPPLQAAYWPETWLPR